MLAGLVLVSGIVSHDVDAEQAGLVSPVEISAAPLHPGAPAHLDEGAELKLHPACVACLLQLGRGTVPNVSPATLPPLPQSGQVTAPAVRLSSATSVLVGPARAPPAASPSA